MIYRSTRLHLRRRPQPTRKSQSKIIKIPHHLKKEQHNGQFVLVAVDATSGPAHIKFL
jgi:nanoRNase/pAp phosphatase (c-di-AMP/oligoRNAs hydrolase)